MDPKVAERNQIIAAAVKSDNPLVVQAREHLLIVTKLADGEEVARNIRSFKQMRLLVTTMNCNIERDLIIAAAVKSDNPLVVRSFEHLLIVTKLAHGEEVAENVRNYKELVSEITHENNERRKMLIFIFSFALAILSIAALMALFVEGVL